MQLVRVTHEKATADYSPQGLSCLMLMVTSERGAGQISKYTSDPPTEGGKGGRQGWSSWAVFLLARPEERKMLYFPKPTYLGKYKLRRLEETGHFLLNKYA